MPHELGSNRSDIRPSFSGRIESRARVLGQISGMPGFQAFWQERRHIFIPALEKYLEQEVFLDVRDPDYHPLGVRRENQRP